MEHHTHEKVGGGKTGCRDSSIARTKNEVPEFLQRANSLGARTHTIHRRSKTKTTKRIPKNILKKNRGGILHWKLGFRVNKKLYLLHL